MKTITIFNEKGGSGKTTLTVLLANYLAYKLGKKVLVLDFDYPNYQCYNMRQKDLRILKDEKSDLYKYSKGQELYNIHMVRFKENMSENTIKDLIKIIRQTVEGFDKDGYILFDFPGRTLPSDPMPHLVFNGLVDKIIIPVDVDRQSITSAMSVCRMLTGDEVKKMFFNSKSPDIAVLWNRETANERSGKRNWYEQANNWFLECGVSVFKRKMREIHILRRDPDIWGFIRNTACWPEINIKLSKADTYLYEILEDMKTWVDEK